MIRPALAKANVSIAIGKGTNISIESADIIFIKGDLSKIVSMISIANGTIKTIRQNLYWGFYLQPDWYPIGSRNTISL